MHEDGKQVLRELSADLKQAIHNLQRQDIRRPYIEGQLAATIRIRELIDRTLSEANSMIKEHKG